MDACKEQKCPQMGKVIGCGSDWKCPGKHFCGEDEVYDFYWRFVAPKIRKIKTFVNDMIVGLENPVGKFTLKGKAQDTLVGMRQMPGAWQICAEKCLSESKGKYFAFNPGKSCSGYNSNAGDCQLHTQPDHTTYKRK